METQQDNNDHEEDTELEINLISSAITLIIFILLALLILGIYAPPVIPIFNR